MRKERYHEKEKPYSLVYFLFCPLARPFCKELRPGHIGSVPPEQAYLHFTSTDGSLGALFSVKYQSLRWVPDVKPHYYLTLVDLKTGQVKKRAEEFISFNMRENFLALARRHAPWCINQIESNVGPYIRMQS